MVTLVVIACVPGCFAMSKAVEGHSGFNTDSGLVVRKRDLWQIASALEAEGGDASELRRVVNFVFWSGSGIDAPPSASTASGRDFSPTIALNEISEAIAAAGVSVDVEFHASGGDGARVYYQRRTKQAEAVPRLTQNARAKLIAAYYRVWVERDGEVTSDEDFQIAVVPGMDQPIEIKEGPD